MHTESSVGIRQSTVRSLQLKKNKYDISSFPDLLGTYRALDSVGMPLLVTDTLWCFPLVMCLVVCDMPEGYQWFTTKVKS